MIISSPGLSDGALFEPSDTHEVRIMVELLHIKSHDICVDLGSGDGRVVMAMAEKGALAIGIEKNIDLVIESEMNIQKRFLSHNAYIMHTNFWDEDLSIFNKVTIFQYQTVMPRLEEKLFRELKSSALVVSHYWPFPAWQPIKQFENMYLYLKP